MRFVVDTAGAILKIKAMRTIAGSGGGAPPGGAAAYQLTAWMTKTLAAVVRAGILHTRSGQLMRNVDFLVSPGPPVQGVIGTGVNKGKPVVYSRIQEEGGDIVPKNVKALTIPLPGVQGRAANYPGIFLIKTKAGKVLLCVKDGKNGIRPLFVLSKKVTLPARHWLSIPIETMRPELNRMIAPETLWAIAQKLGGYNAD